MEDYAGKFKPSPADPQGLLRLPLEECELEQIEAELRRVCGSLNGADPLRRATIRVQLVREVQERGVSHPTRMVDAAFSNFMKETEKTLGQGRKIEFEDAEPWTEAVDGVELLNDLAALFSKYIVLPAGGEIILALWVAHTYLVDAFEHTGYLGIISATRECGKTTTLQLVAGLVYRPISTGNITSASLFRVVEDAHPTLIIDELDRVSADSDVWQLLNDGFRRTGGVIRTVGDSHEPRVFSTWSAKALGFIRKARTKIPDTVLDRTIFVELARKKKTEHRARLRTKVLQTETAPLRRKLARWAGDHSKDVAGAGSRLPEELNDREADCWEPLLAVADAVGGEWPEMARRVACSQSLERADDEADDLAVLILLDLHDLLDSGDLTPDEHGLAAESMVEALKGLDDRPWRTTGKDEKGLTAHTLARFLRPHGLRPQQVGPKTERVRRYDAAGIRDVAERFKRKCSPAHPPQTVPASLSATRGEHMSTSDVLTGGKLDAEPENAFAGPGDAAVSRAPDPADCLVCGKDSCPGCGPDDAPQAGVDGWKEY